MPTGRKVDARSIRGAKLKEKKKAKKKAGKSTFSEDQAIAQNVTNTGKSKGAKRAQSSAAARRKAGRLSQIAKLEDPNRVDGVKVGTKPVTPVKKKAVRKKVETVSAIKPKAATTTSTKSKATTKPKKKFVPLSGKEQKKAQRQRKKYDRAVKKGNKKKASAARKKGTKIINRKK